MPVFVGSTTTTTTDSSCTLDLNPGHYLICETKKRRCTKSASDKTSGVCATGLANGGFAVVVSSGSSATGKDFGNYRKGSVSGTKFEDPNADGKIGRASWRERV